MSTEAEEPDDLTVADECHLFRRIPGNQIKPTNDGGYQPISGAFNNSSGPERSMSVSLGDTMEAYDRTPGDLVAPYPDTYVASITARLARDEEQVLRRSPTGEDVAHGDVIGDKNSKSRRRRFAKAAEWAVPPPSLP